MSNLEAGPVSVDSPSIEGHRAPSQRRVRFAFHHVGVAVENIDVSRKMYADALGLGNVHETIDVPSQKVRTCFIETLPGAYVELVQALSEDSPVHNKRGPYHVCFSVGDLEDAVRELRGRGFLLVGRIDQRAMGMQRWAYLVAPDALLVELCEPARDTEPVAAISMGAGQP